MSRQDTLFSHLDRLRKGYVRGRAGLLALGTATVLAGTLLLWCLLDVTLWFGPVVCWLGWLVMAALFGLGVFRVFRRLRTPLSHQAAAVLVERVVPGLENHLINAVQFAERDPGAGRFVEALLTETAADLAELRSSRLYSPKPRQWLLGLLAGFILAGLAATVFLPRQMAHAAGRVLLPYAGIRPFTRTQLVKVSPGTVTVLRGEEIRIEAQLAGRLGAEARIEWRRGRGRLDVVPMDAADAGDAALAEGGSPSSPSRAGVIRGVFENSAYRVVAGDDQSAWYEITVTNPPGLERWKANVTPPGNTGRPAFSLEPESADMGVPAGSQVVLAGAATAALAKASVTQDETVVGEKELDGSLKFGVGFMVRDGGPVRLTLHGNCGLDASFTLPLAVLPDRKPAVVLVETRQRMLVERDGQVAVSFQAEDDYGLSEIGFERITGEEEYESVSFVKPPPGLAFAGRFLVDMATFGARPGDTLRFRVWAEDNGMDRLRRRGYSPVVQLTVPAPEEQRAAKKKLVEQVQERIQELVRMQRDNLRNTRQIADLATLGRNVSSPQIQPLELAQKNIRELAVDLLGDRVALGEFATVLANLVNHEMAEALVKFEEAHRAEGEALVPVLAACVRLETHILAALTGIPVGLGREQQHQETADLFSAYQNLVAKQRKNLEDSKLAQQGEANAQITLALAEVEDMLANELVAFCDKCLIMVEERADDDFARQVRKVYDLLDSSKCYERMIGAAESLEEGNFALGIQRQEEIMRTLMEGLNILNLWRMRNAQRVVAEAAELLKKVSEELDGMENKQAQIAEVTRDLAKRGQIDDEVREKLREMDEEQKEMAAMLEQLANDLYQFPELPVCDELNSKMREIFEDVEQAMNSENAPAMEIAVQKEDSLLDAIRKTKERVEDVEMWLPDIPDNIVWNMETFDTDEFPEIPLVPLPDELEDIVGDLLDQASDIDAQSQDTTGNNIIADIEMGWAVMDGPMPSFAAKGKSGNTRPNDNEMTGRSGAGREGQATGELVENHVKGLEGRETHARRTQDPFQKGMVTEDEDSTMDARATGGGKLGGESESIGMFGNAPRRDLHTKDHGANPMQLRQETEALYAKARLLYLGTGRLGAVSRELRGIEEAGDQIRTMGSLHQRVLRRLEDTQVELNSGVVLPMPVATVSRTGGAVVDDVDMSKISAEYRDVVSDYYRSLEARP
ncbi:MAG: hypothetical protein RBS99_15220 [Rhodospirillales bacterium]|jgi:hypothetical protein|nr:hypothetical protein [Rhodospirillales bacterium]